MNQKMFLINNKKIKLSIKCNEIIKANNKHDIEQPPGQFPNIKSNQMKGIFNVPTLSF